MGSTGVSGPPTITFRMKNMKPGTSSWLSVSKEVVKAFEEYGCFIAVCDQVSTELNKQVFGALPELFDLPLETKVKNVSEKPYFGYVGQVPIIPLHESMGMMDATTVEGAESFTKVMFPSGNQHFSETMHSYAKKVSELEQMVKKMVFQSYGVEKLYDSQMESTVSYLLRFMKYRLPQKDETNTGVGVHTDKSFITILDQNEENGLEILTKSGEWFDVNYPPSSFMVMAGDAMMAWSNGRVHCSLHRVNIKGDKERYSTGIFSYNDGIIEVPEELVNEEHPRKYKSFNHYELLYFIANNMGRLSESKSTMQAYCGVDA